MKTDKLSRVGSLALCMGMVLAVLLQARGQGATGGMEAEAQQIAALADFKGGLVIHIGCGDGALTACLRLSDRCVVQGLDDNPENVKTARETLRALGLYGPVSVMQLSGKKLPHADNLATLVVCEDHGVVPMNEIMRVVRPLGAVAIKRKGEWTAKIKPFPADIDEWQQHYGDADNNAVANDTVVGPPRRFQWIAEPEWQRSHLAMPSINSMVSARGRLFTLEDLGSAEHPALPGKYAIVSRDAYNGVVLWKVMFKDWHPIIIRMKNTPVQLQRRLVAVNDTVYCTPGYTEPITAYDAATGELKKEFTNTAGTMEFVYDRDILFVVIGDQEDVPEELNDTSRGAFKESMFRREAYGPMIQRKEKPENLIMAVDVKSGEELWKISGTETEGYQGTSLGVSGDRLVYSTVKELVCVDCGKGKELWRVPAPVNLEGPSGIAVSLVLSERSAFLADSQQMRAFRLSDGKKLWATPATINHHKAPDVFVVDDLVWVAGYDASIGKVTEELPKMGVNAFDADTGRLVKSIEQIMHGPMGHDRCYRNRITTNYYVNSMSGGSDYLDFESSEEMPAPWIRGTCSIGPLPCNGLHYAGPPSCSCANSVMLNAFNAFSTEPDFTTPSKAIQVNETETLDKGSAYEAVGPEPSRFKPGDWPTYRHDIERSGATQAKVPAKLAKRWETKLGAKVSAPVIADGMLFAADVDGDAVFAVNAEDGKIAWCFTTDSRVDSPPTIHLPQDAQHAAVCLFGSHDGSVYCLRASDGALAWRFSPLEQRLMCAYERPESAWPVCGSILVKDGLAYFAAGRNSFADGGIFLYALDALTGKVVHRQHMFGPYGDNGHPIENRDVVGGTSIAGFKMDIFLSAGDQLFLRHQGFMPDLTPVDLKDNTIPHLIPSHGFLESIPQHRSFWTIDTMLRYDIPTGFGGVQGDILVREGENFYEVRGYQPGRTAMFDPRAKGYTLYAGIFRNERPPDPNPQAKEGATVATKTRARKTGAMKTGARKAAARKKRRLPRGFVSSDEIWSSSIPLTGKALVLADDVLFVAGTPVEFPEDDLAKAYEGRMGGILWAASKLTGEKLAEYKLDAPPAWDGLAAVDGRLYLSLADGRILCMEQG